MFHVEQKMIIMDLKQFIREVPDYPKPGVNFFDITTLLKNTVAFNYVVDRICDYSKNMGITKIVTLESRGFIVGGAVAYNINAGFVPIRKKGKLPAETISEEYELEYGTDTIEIHSDALDSDDVVLIHDDLLATGGTAQAALNIVKKLNVKKIYLSFIIDLAFLQNENKKQIMDLDPHVLVSY